MAKIRVKNCKLCGKEFHLYARRGRKEQEYCSRKCSGLVQRKRANLICQNCGKEFIVHDCHLGTKHTGKFCSLKCTHEAFEKGIFDYGKKQGPNSGRYVDYQGYVHISRNGVHYREHRHVMEVHLGRSLHKWETVHHKNGDRADNRLDNLEVWVGNHPTGASHLVEYISEISTLNRRIVELEQEVKLLKGEHNEHWK